MPHRADVAVVGSGIVGLAFAWEAARRDRSVVVFDRDPAPRGASVRNFGMIWPVGQPKGPSRDLALKSRDRWAELGRRAGVEVAACGSLHVAHAADEAAVLAEFAERNPGGVLLGPAETVREFPAVNPEGLVAAYHSRTELAIDPRQALHQIPLFLAETFGVTFCYGTAVTRVEPPAVTTAAGDAWHAEQVFVCSGADFETLFPAAYASLNLRRCKLQMLRTRPQPAGFRLGTHLAAGLTLAHYPAFQECLSLPALKDRFATRYADYVRYGIHVMAAQTASGEVVLGDSHEYDGAIEPFDKPEIDDLILKYARAVFRLPDWTIAARWHGVYGLHPTEKVMTVTPAPCCTIVVSPGGAGMTLAFGLAEDWYDRVGSTDPAK
jgi:FAD dependent oxidoreductase TIGR03364